MERYFPVLLSCPLFDGIDRQDLRGFLSCLGARVLPMRKGQTIFREGDPAGSIGIVASGGVQLIREDYYGNRSVVGHVGTAQLFGEAYAFSTAATLPVSVVAQEEGAVVLLHGLRITSRCSNACGFHNQVIFNLLRLVSNKNLMLHQKIQVTSQRTTREKLMTYLLHQAKVQGSNAFTIPFDRQALADYLEVDRSGLSAEISKLRKEGILESEKNHFRLR